jgi:hypothetical protein
LKILRFFPISNAKHRQGQHRLSEDAQRPYHRPKSTAAMECKRIAPWRSYVVDIQFIYLSCFLNRLDGRYDSLFLFCGDYGILEGVGHPHLNNSLGRNFNGLAGLGIPTGTGFAFGKDEFAELFFLLGWDLGSK